MGAIVTDHLLRSLEGLLPYEFKTFKLLLQNIGLENQQPRIHRGQLHETTPVQVVDLLLTHYGQRTAVLLTLHILRTMNQNLLAENLHSALTPEFQAGGASAPGSSTTRTPETLEGEVQRAVAVRRREPSLPRTARKPMGTGKPQSPAGEQGSRLRRNASSAGRLQNLWGSVRPREGLQNSGKKRPKSLEFNITLGDKDAAHFYALLAQEKWKSESLDFADAPGWGLEAPRKGPRHPEHSKGPEGVAVCNIPTRVSLSKEKTCSAPSRKSGMAGPEAPRVVVPPSSGRPQDRAVCPLCRTQEGDLCAHEVCSCSMAPNVCPQCQAPLPGKRGQGRELQENLKGTSLLPQCKCHPRQAQLFWKDHREPICRVCSLSVGYRGHHTCSIEEAAQEYKEQIEKQLEYLKELRISGEEQRSQGDQKTANLLKATETQKQKLRCQLKDLCQFLEQQEQLFVAWLKDLEEKSFDQLHGANDTHVSRDIALLDEQTGELKAKHYQAEWELMQDIRGTLRRAQSMMVPEPWATSAEMKEKLHLLYQKSEFMEKSLKWFSETLRSEMETFSADVTLDIETAHANLTFSDDLKTET